MKTQGPLYRLCSTLYNGMDAIVNILHTVCGMFTLGFFCLTFFQVVMRFCFGKPIFGIEEAVLATVVWTTALGMAIVYWHNEHPKLTVLMEILPSWLRILMHYVTSVIVLILGWFFLEGGLFFFQIQMKTTPTGGLPFCKAYYYALPMLVAGALLLVMAAIRILHFTVIKDESIMKDIPEEGGVSVD